MFNNPAEAYDRAAKVTASNRELEAAALFKAARILEACRFGWNAPDRDQRLEHALRNNQRLWTLFQSELIESNQGLSGDLRLNVLKLSAFVDQRTFEIMAAPNPDKLQALIQINRHVAAGLSGSAA